MLIAGVSLLLVVVLVLVSFKAFRGRGGGRGRTPRGGRFWLSSWLITSRTCIRERTGLYAGPGALRKSTGAGQSLLHGQNNGADVLQDFFRCGRVGDFQAKMFVER